MKIKEKIKEILKKCSRVSMDDKLFFIQQIGIMVKTGISLSVALQTLAEQTSSRKFKMILEDLKKEVEKGNMLSQGMEKYPKIFGELFVNMIKSGEASGKLEEILQQLYVQLKKDHDLIGKVRGAMIYPSVVVCAMAGVCAFVIIYVIPNLTQIFKEINAPLPLATRMLIGLSDFVVSYGIIVLIILAVAAGSLIKFIRAPRGKKIWHQFLLGIPIMGEIIKKINLARFCRTLSSLLKTDIDVVKSFEITSGVVGNYLFKKALLDAKDKIKKGFGIKNSLEPYKKLYPPVVLQMINVGEETGTLDEILQEAATFYEDDIDRTMTNLPSIIEPVLIVVLGVGVAAMAVAIIMPMYSLSQSI